MLEARSRHARFIDWRTSARICNDAIKGADFIIITELYRLQLTKVTYVWR